MPITQDRIISLLDDFTSTRNSYTAIRAELKALLTRPEPDWRFGIEYILLNYPMPSSEAYAVEKHHFSRNSRRNDKLALKMRAFRARQKEGAPLGQTKTRTSRKPQIEFEDDPLMATPEDFSFGLAQRQANPPKQGQTTLPGQSEPGQPSSEHILSPETCSPEEWAKILADDDALANSLTPDKLEAHTRTKMPRP